MSDYRYQIVNHKDIPSLHVMIEVTEDTYDRDIQETHIPIDDIQRSIRLKEIPALESVESVLKRLTRYYHERAQTCHRLASTSTDQETALRHVAGANDFLARRDAVLKVADNLGITISKTGDYTHGQTEQGHTG